MSGFTSSQTPGIAISPLSVGERREHFRKRHRRIGNRAAPHSGVNRLGERAHFDFDADQAAERDCERGNAAIEIARIRQHENVRVEHLAMGFQELLEVRASDFFFAFDDDFHVDRKLAHGLQESIDRSAVNDHAGFVVRGAATVEARAARARLSRSVRKEESSKVLRAPEAARRDARTEAAWACPELCRRSA